MITGILLTLQDFSLLPNLHLLVRGLKASVLNAWSLWSLSCAMSGIKESKKTEGNKEDAPLKYLESTPPAFKEIADAILILDSGEKLPAHR